MDFTLIFPIEICLRIVSLLEGDEIFSCLGVSRRWRSIFNCDEFWKPLCHKARIFDPVLPSKNLLDPFSLCSWAEAYYHFRCVPLKNWRTGNWHYLNLEREESDYYCDAWDGHNVAVYYYTLGKINLYSIYKKIEVKQVIKVKLPKKEVYNNASISINDPYLVAARFNVAIIYKRNVMFSAIQYVSVKDSFDFGFNLSKRNTKLGAEIAWGCLWMKAEPVKDTFIIDLKNFSTKYITGKPHLAFNDNVKLVIAWTKSSVRVASLTGNILLTLERNKIRSVDYNSKLLVLKVENNLEVLDIKTGVTISIVEINEKMEFALGHSLLMLVGNKTSSLSSLSLETVNNIWTLGGLKGKASDIRFIGSRYIFVVPSFRKDHYCLVDWKGRFIRESPLPDMFDQFPSPVFAETLPFLVITNENSFSIMSFL